MPRKAALKVVEKKVTPKKRAPVSKVTRIATRKHEKRDQELLARVGKIRALRALGVQNEAEAMLQTYKLYKQPSLWRTTARPSEFEDEVVTKFNLCTSISRWRAFLKAKKHENVTDKHIRTLGIPAICLIMKQSPRRQWKLLQAAVTFRKRNGVEPTYQHISQLIGPRKKSAKATRRELENYIEDLKGVITKLGGRVPTMERF